MSPPWIVIAMWSMLRDAWTGARARWRADAARTWPLPVDLWHGWSIGYLQVVCLERRGDEAGVRYQHGRVELWTPMRTWGALTQRLVLVERAGVRDGE